MLKSLPSLLLVLLAMPLPGNASCGPTTTASTSPTTAPSTQAMSLSITYTLTGGFAGTTKITTLATADVQFDPPPLSLARLSSSQAQAVADLLRRESVLQWPQGIKGRGEYFDNYHYFLDVNLNGQESHIHAADLTDTAAEARRIQQLMTRINKIISAGG